MIEVMAPLGYIAYEMWIEDRGALDLLNRALPDMAMMAAVLIAWGGSAADVLCRRNRRNRISAFSMSYLSQSRIASRTRTR